MVARLRASPLSLDRYSANYCAARGIEIVKAGGQEREHVATKVGRQRLDLGIGKASVDLPMQTQASVGPKKPMGAACHLIE